jgi:two-component system response regulator RegA
MVSETAPAPAIPGDDPSLLIVDDDKPFPDPPGARNGDARLPGRAGGSVAEALAKVRAKAPAYAVVDMRLGDGNGLDVITAIHEKRADARAIILTGYGNIATAVTAVKLGAIDYLSSRRTQTTSSPP